MSQRLSEKPSPLKRSKKVYQDLKTVVSKPGQYDSTIGIILDATGDYKTDDSYDYVTKIKLIDSKYNPSKEKVGKKKSHVMVFIFSYKLSDTPHIRKLGDIILLRNFKFDNYKDIVKGYNSKGGSEWQIFDSRKNMPIQAISCSKDLPSPLSLEEKTAIAHLKDFGYQFFSQTSLYNLGWFDREVSQKVSSNNILYRKDIDMIVKVVQDVRTIIDGVIYDKLVFTDKERRLYFAEIKGLGNDFEIGSVVKLRSVTLTVTDEINKIDFYNYSKILYLQNHFADTHTLQTATAKVDYSSDLLVNQFIQEFHLEKYQHEEIAPQTYLYHLDKINFELLEEEKRQLVSSYPILMSFDTKDASLNKDKKKQYGTCIMKRYSDNEVYSVKQLSELLNEFNSNPDELQSNINRAFVVEGHLESFQYYKPSEMFKIYSPSSNKTWELKDFESAQQCGIEDLKIIVHNVVFMKNTSNDKEEPLPLYIASYDQNPQFIFDLWRVLPDYNTLPDWRPKNKDLIEKFKQFTDCMKKVEKINKPYKFVVELTTSEPGKAYFRVIDTIFWFLKSD